LAQAYARQQRFELVQEFVDYAERESPNDPRILEAAATLYEEMNQTDRAVDVYRRAIACYPDDALYYARLGAIYLRRRVLDDARAMYEKAVDLDRNDPETLFKLSELYIDEGLIERACALLEHAVEVDPSHSKAHLLLSEVYQRLGRERQAIHHYKQAAVLASPNSVVSRQARHKLAKLAPEMPEGRAQGWGETLRRTFALVLPQLLAALVNAGLVPWRINLTAGVALMAASVGAFLWTCAADVPRNQLMRVLFGKAGVEGFWRKALVGGPGVLLWGVAFGLILGRV
jgi:tetratricopeptide (TPR) repeat protein